MTTAFKEKVLSAVTTGTSTPIDTLNCQQITVISVFSAGVGAGVVTLETAPTPDYAGTWGSLGTQSFAADTAVVSSGVQGPRVFPYVRVRITTTVTGGTVDVWICGNST